MKRLNTSVYLIALLALVVVIVLLALLLPDGGGNIEVMLPSGAVSTGDELTSGGWRDDDSRIEVNPETVQEVIGTLEAAMVYSREITFKTFWPGGEGLSTITVKANNDKLRIRETIGGESRNALILGEELYIWYDGGEVFAGRAAQNETDRLQRMISVSHILEIPESDILEASYTELDGVPCVYVKFLSGELGFTEGAYVSVATGLLMAADSYDGDTLLSQLRSSEPDLSTPDDGEFVPPKKL